MLLEDTVMSDASPHQNALALESPSMFQLSSGISLLEMEPVRSALPRRNSCRRLQWTMESAAAEEPREEAGALLSQSTTITPASSAESSVPPMTRFKSAPVLHYSPTLGRKHPPKPTAAPVTAPPTQPVPSLASDPGPGSGSPRGSCRGAVKNFGRTTRKAGSHLGLSRSSTFDESSSERGAAVQVKPFPMPMECTALPLPAPAPLSAPAPAFAPPAPLHARGQAASPSSAPGSFRSTSTPCAAASPSFPAGKYGGLQRNAGPPSLAARQRNTISLSVDSFLLPAQQQPQQQRGGEHASSDPCDTRILPTLSNGKHPELKAIGPATMVQVLQGAYASYYDAMYIVDCRYPYEFEGGHVERAINCFEPDQVVHRFLNSGEVAPGPRTLVVFYCEFSSQRGPTAYRELRKADRMKNWNCYPAIHFPEIYLLEGGYKRFFEEANAHCSPRDYVPMEHKGYRVEKKVYTVQLGKSKHRASMPSLTELVQRERDSLTLADRSNSFSHV